jgi:hypothetical protein
VLVGVLHVAGANRELGTRAVLVLAEAARIEPHVDVFR